MRKSIYKALPLAQSDRGHEIFRIEALSDAVFAFSVSLLIMSLEVPASFEAFRHTILNFPPFLATVAMVFFFWYLQNRFFRSYGLNNGRIIFLNLCLLTIILFYAFPLKYLFALLLSWLAGKNFMPGEHEDGFPLLTIENFNELVIIFSIGYSIIWLIFWLLYRQAWISKTDLHLTQKEEILLQADIRDSMVQVFIGLTGLLFAILKLSAISGFAFLCIPVWLIIHGFITKKKMKKG
jgi:uncharacterized membrane protein